MENNIIKFEQNKTGIVFTQLEKEILSFKDEISIKTTEPNILIKKIKEFISGAYFNAGFQIKGDNEKDKSNQLVLMAQSFIREAINLFPNLNLKDIEIAFRRGVLKEYGEYMGISVATLISWLKSYKTEKQEAIYKNNKIKDRIEAKTQLNDNEIENIMIEGAKKSFEIYKTKGYCTDFGNAIYNYLDKKNMLGYTKDDKNEYINAAIELLKKENEPLNATNKQKQKEMINIIKILSSNPMEKKEIIISKAKELALNDYFKNIEELTFE